MIRGFAGAVRMGTGRMAVAARHHMRRLLEYAFALTACAVAALFLLGLARADLSVPFWYDGDALYYGAVVKAIAEHGSHLTNPRLGMPFGQELHDFPMPDALSFALLRALAAVWHDDARVMNVFYLASFPLTTVTALWVLRHLGLSYWPALLASLLFVFTPHHLIAGEHHLMYTTYWTVPPMVWVLVRIATGELAVDRWRDLGTRRVLAALLACAAIASTGGAYYPFFACLFLGSAALYAATVARAVKPLLLPLLLGAFTFAVFVMNLLPCIEHRLQHGATTTAQRSPIEAEVFALKLTQVVLPVADHRLPAFAATRRAYDLHASPLHANQPVALGVLGSFGVAFLTGWLLYRRRREQEGRRARLLDGLSVLHATGLLAGTVGGVGALFAFLGSAQIRNYATIIVFLAMFAFTAVGLCLDALRPAAAPARRAAFAGATVVLLVLGLLDQTPSRVFPDLAATQRAHAADRRFFAQVEGAVAAGAMVFQVPRYEFPEGGSYEHLKGYLHTRTLRWSFGAMRGRAADRWQRHVVGLAPDEMVDTLAAAGFAGICFDRTLGSDAERALEAAVGMAVGPPSLVSDDGRYAFVSWAERAARLAARPDAAQQRERALYPVFTDWGPEFTSLAPAATRRWRGCGARGAITFDNPLPRARRVRLTLTVVAPRGSTLTLAGPGWSERVPLSPQPSTWSRDFELPAGPSRMQLTSDGPVIPTLAWLPPMAFGVSELAIRDLDAAAGPR